METLQSAEAGQESKSKRANSSAPITDDHAAEHLHGAVESSATIRADVSAGPQLMGKPETFHGGRVIRSIKQRQRLRDLAHRQHNSRHACGSTSCTSAVS
jgi:hypothetical protein